MTSLDPAPTTDRQESILAAAFHAFATYGYRRTSMDDIARGANMSRSALYLHYRNKEDIFRSLTADYFAQSLADLETALMAPGQTPEQALAAAFIAKDGKFMDVVLSAPHGDELLDAGLSISRDLVDQAEAEKIRILAHWLTGLPMAGGIGTAQEVARTIITSAMGLKYPGQTLEGYRRGQHQLASLFARAITA